MPNEYSNFTDDDATQNPTGGYRGAPAGPGAGDPGANSHWDPNMYNPQTQSNGAWVPNDTQTAGNASSASPTFQPGSIGGMGNMVDGQGNDIPGTSSAALASDRYRHMAQNPLYTSGPKIDTSVSDESRGMSMGALGLLGAAAAGTSPSVAEQLGTKQAQNAEAAQVSTGASIRGGGMARAAAMRNAQNNAATIAQQQIQANAATRAGEMAGARGAYLNAATGQRNTDLTGATDQAKLQAGQNASNDQHTGFYEDMSQSTKDAQLSHQLGHTAAEDAATNAAKATAMAGDAAAQQRAWRDADTATAAITGGAEAAGKFASGSDAPKKPDDTFDSDENMKTNKRSPASYETQLSPEEEVSFGEWKKDNAPYDSGDDYDYRGAFKAGAQPGSDGHWTDTFKKPNHPTFSNESQYASAGPHGHWVGDKFVPPMNEKDAAKLAAKSELMLAGAKANLDAGPSVGPDKKKAEPLPASPKARARARASKMADQPNPYDDYDRSMFAKADDGTAANTNALHAGIEAQIAKDHPALPETMAGTPNPYAHHALFGGAPEGYAKSRRGQPGYILGGPQASYKDMLWGPGEKDAGSGLAPGSDDFASTHASRWNVPVDQSWKHQQYMTSDVHAKREAFQDGVDAAKLDGGIPSYMFEKPRGESSGGKAASTSVARRDSAPQRQEVLRREQLADTGHGYIAKGAAGMAVSPAVGAGAMMGGANLAYNAVGPNQGPMPVAPPTQRPLPVPPVAPPPPPPVEVATTSDERAKKVSKKHEPMSSVMRSMKPSVYEYKPEFAAQNGQRVGEKNVGPMAQNLAADPLARTAVVKDEKTGMLGLSIPKSVKLVMGSLHSVGERLDALEKKKRSASSTQIISALHVGITGRARRVPRGWNSAHS